MSPSNPGRNSLLLNTNVPIANERGTVDRSAIDKGAAGGLEPRTYELKVTRRGTSLSSCLSTRLAGSPPKQRSFFPRRTRLCLFPASWRRSSDTLRSQFELGDCSDGQQQAFRERVLLAF